MWETTSFQLELVHKRIGWTSSARFSYFSLFIKSGPRVLPNSSCLMFIWKKKKKKYKISLSVYSGPANVHRNPLLLPTLKDCENVEIYSYSSLMPPPLYRKNNSRVPIQLLPGHTEARNQWAQHKPTARTSSHPQESVGAVNSWGYDSWQQGYYWAAVKWVVCWN